MKTVDRYDDVVRVGSHREVFIFRGREYLFPTEIDIIDGEYVTFVVDFDDNGRKKRRRPKKGDYDTYYFTRDGYPEDSKKAVKDSIESLYTTCMPLFGEEYTAKQWADMMNEWRLNPIDSS